MTSTNLDFNRFNTIDPTKIRVSSCQEANKHINPKNLRLIFGQKCFQGLVSVSHGFIVLYNKSFKIPIKLLSDKLKTLSPYFNYKGSMPNTGVAFFQVVFILTQILVETIIALKKWWDHKYDTKNTIRNKLLFHEDLKRIWIANAVQGTVMATSTIAIGSMLANLIATAWLPFAAGIIGSLFGFCAKSLVSYTFFKKNCIESRVDEAIWKEFATKENKQVKELYGNDKLWPSTALELAKYLNDLKCLQDALEGKLTIDKVKTTYKVHSQMLELEKSNMTHKYIDVMDEKELELKYIICLRYVKFILEPSRSKIKYQALKTKYKKKYLENLQLVVANACKRYIKKQKEPQDGFFMSWMKWISGN